MFVANMSRHSYINYIIREERFNLSFVNYSLRNFSEISESKIFGDLDSLSSLGNDFCKVMFYMLACLFLIGIVFNIMSIIRPQMTVYYKCQFLSSVLETVVFVISSVVAVVNCEYYNANYKYVLGGDDIMTSEQFGSLALGHWFYISLVLCLLIVGVELYFVLASKQGINTKKQGKKEEGNTISMLNEYKRLLDNGVITEEEFSSMKKELLKL